MYDQSADDFTFAEIRAILERRYARRMRVIKTFLGSTVAIAVIIFLAVIASMYMASIHLQNTRSQDVYFYINSSNQIISMVAIGVIFLVVIRFTLVLFDMFVGGAKDRALRQEIEQERTWRLRQWQARGYRESDADVYQMSDDGEIETYASQSKRKRLTEHEF